MNADRGRTVPNMDPRITAHPEYTRTYQHYISHGSSPEEAARLAYEHTQKQLPQLPPAKKSSGAKIALIAVGAVVGLCVVGGIATAIAGGGDKPEATGPTASASPGASVKAAQTPGKPAEDKPGLGDPVNDGNFQFTVTAVKCGASKVGTVLTKTAQGQFCMVAVTVRNVKKDPRMFDASSQKAFGADGAEFGSDGTASLYVNENNETFLNEINPGNEVRGTLVFDIPKTAKIARLEFHDSAFSGGVQVFL